MRTFVAALIVLAGAGAASAADVVVAGSQLLLRAGRASKLVLKLADPAVPDPAPGSADDPSVGGLVLTIFGRGRHEVGAVYVRPDATPGWRVSAASPRRYTLDDRDARFVADSFRRAVLRGGKSIELRAASSGGLPFLGPEGSIAVRVQIGTTRLCAVFDGASVQRDETGLFAARNAPRPAGITDCDDATLQGAAPCGDTYPACGGSCPEGLSCFLYEIPLGQNDHCVCATGPQPPPCDPGCTDGWSCELVGGQGYFCVPPACQGGSGAPACDGACAAGQDCMITPGDRCFCIDTCVGGDGFPACNGTCERPGWTCQAGPESCGCLPPT